MDAGKTSALGVSQNQVQNQKTNFSPNWINLGLVPG
jgi:hypothetical protein